MGKPIKNIFFEKLDKKKIQQRKVQGVQKYLTSFTRPIILVIFVEINSNFHRMYKNKSRFYI